MREIILHVTYRCVSGKAENFIHALKESGLQAAVRAEDGCMQYDYLLSCEQADTVVLLEKGRDAAALEPHGKQLPMNKG